MAGRRKHSASPEKGRKRFKFKSFAERIEEIDIDVFHSLDSVKSQPTAEGGSFFYESLCQWRELNATSDFVELYQELFPLVQTLPQLLHQKTTVITRLVSCLQPSSLALEPVFSLLAVLSRDLSEDFLQFIPELFDAYLRLLQSGGDRDPTVLQGFTFVAYIFKYMLKYLSKNVTFVLKVTRSFRFYHQDYVRDFAAEAVSFVLRNAPLTQVVKGVRRLISETEKGASEENISGCSALLTCTLKGPSAGFHSRAGELLKLLLSTSILSGVRQGCKGDVVLEVLKQTLSNLCKDVDRSKLDLLWSCLLDELSSPLFVLEKECKWSDEAAKNVRKLLMLINHVCEYEKGRYMNDKKLLVAVAPRLLNLVPKIPGESNVDFLSEAFKVLVNAIKKKATEGIGVDAAAPAWNVAIESTPSGSVLPFIKALLEQETLVVKPFELHVLRGLERHVESDKGRVLPLLLALFEKLELRSVNNLKLCTAIFGVVHNSLENIRSGSCHQTSEEAAMVLTALRCLPCFTKTDELQRICWDYATAVDQFVVEVDGTNANDWNTLLGAALLSHMKFLTPPKQFTVEEFVPYLNFGLKYLHSSYVLEAVAKCGLEFTRLEDTVVKCSVDLNHQALLKNYKLYEKNLWSPCKKTRMATLQILSLYEQNHAGAQILDDLLAIESTPLDIEHSRRFSSLILQIKMSVAGKPVEIVRLAFHAVIGVLQNRFSPLWEPVMNCASAILQANCDNLRNDFLSCLSATQAQCLQEANDSSGDSQLPWNVLTVLLRIAQKSSSTFVPISNELVSLFLEFAEHKLEHKRGSLQTGLNKNDWRVILKEWLQLLSQMKNLSGLSNGHALKQLIMERFLVFKDPDIQKKALDCLLNWKDSSLTSYKDHLHKLISADSIREELASWSVSKENQEVANEHRALLAPVLVRVLYPKLSRRHTKMEKLAGHMRFNILTFLSNLDVKELNSLFSLIIRPFEAACDSSLKPSLSLNPEENYTEDFIDKVDMHMVAELPYKTKVGFLYLVKDIFQVFDGEQIEPYLPALMGFVFRLLESSSLTTNCEDEHKRQAPLSKDLRSLCLKVISLLLNTFSNINFGSRYWDVFFKAAERSIALLKEENTGDKPTALLSCFLAMSSNKEFTSLLLRNESLVPNIFSIFLVKNLSVSVRSAVLQFIRSLLGMDNKILELSVLPHLSLLLQGLAQQLSKQSASKEKYLKDQLQIISTVSPHINDPLLASEFLQTLLPFFKTRKPDPEVTMEILKILTNLAHHFDADSISKCMQAFKPLFLSIICKETRCILSQCLKKLATVDSFLGPVAEILDDLNAMSRCKVDECDYDRRQAGYGKVTQSFLAQVDCREALLLLSHVVFDLESEDMRYNASSCLITVVRAAAQRSMKEDVYASVYDFLFSRVIDSLKSEDAALRREWLIIFRELVNLSDVSTLLEYQCLTSSDVEVDFFSNIIHIQVHRRIKAMAKFRANASRFSQQSLIKVFTPLFLHFLFEARSNKDGNLIDAALETLGSVAAQLQSAHAVNFVTECFRLLSTKSVHQKVLVRLICLVLEGTEFSHMGDKESRFLEVKVLPQLRKLLLNNESVNVPVSLVSIKVLQLMPEQVISTHLPQIFQTITNILKSRSQEIRDEARSSIVGMVEILGPKYIQFAVRMLHSSLNRGYEKHVLGYTLNTILIRLVPTLEVGDIDYCLKDIITILEDEVFGEVSAEKEVEALASKMKERKQARSYDSFRLIARIMTFDSSIHQLLLIVREKNSTSSKIFEKLQWMLKSVAEGIQDNPSATDEKVFTLSQELLEKLFKQKVEAAMEKEDDSSIYILSEFGVNILHNRLRHLQGISEKLGKLDPFVHLLERCLSVKYTGVISGAMRCLSVLLKLPLSTIPSAVEPIVRSVCSLAASSSSTESPLMQACMKVLSVILRHCKSVALSDAQAHELLRLNIFVEIEKQSAPCLSLLKALVQRKIVVAEVYDLMTRVQALMITSQCPSVRQRCSEILLQFLLDYPLGPKRLQRHFDFLLGNLGYEHISGREAALEMMHTVIVKFPAPVLEELSESLFLTLITRLANDKDSHVHLLLQTVLRVLMERVGQKMLDHMKGCLFSWMSSGKQSLWLPAAQATGLLVDVMDKAFERHLNDFWPVVLELLKHSAENKVSSWKETFYVLVLLEKLFKRFPSRFSEETWSVIQEFLLHSNVSVRTVSARLFGSYLEGSDPKFLKDLQWLLLFGAICCEQMTSEVFDEELGNHAVQNLTTVATVFSSISMRPEDVKDDTVAKAMTLLRQKPGADQLTNPLIAFLRRLDKISFDDTHEKCVLKWYSSLAGHLGREGLLPYLPRMLSHILKVERSTAPAEVKGFAEGVREELRELVGPEIFATSYHQVSLEVKQRKENRKREKSVAALVDPEKTARKKIKLGLKKGAQKKRKRSSFRKH